MRITWLGHGSFRLDVADNVLLIDPWFSGNPLFPKDRRAEAIRGATHILLTHGHHDHTADAAMLAAETGSTIYCNYDLGMLLKQQGTECVGFNKGGTVQLGSARVTMVNASHSSSIMIDNKLYYAGHEVGFIISDDKNTVYFSGDTDIMADMQWIGAYFKPDIGVLSCGGFFTMDMKAAAWAARTFFNFSHVIPSHYKTFPILEQSTRTLAEGLPGVKVLEPEVMTPLEF